MQMHAQIAHQELHRRLEVCRAWPVGRVKQAPESTVHAQHVKQVNIVRQRRQMLRRVSTAQRVTSTTMWVKVHVCHAVLENSMILLVLSNANYVRLRLLPLKKVETVIVLRAPLEQRLLWAVHLVLHQQSPVVPELHLKVRCAKLVPSLPPAPPVKQVPVPTVHAKPVKQVNSEQLRMQLLQPVWLAQLASIKVSWVLFRVSHACQAGTKM